MINLSSNSRTVNDFAMVMTPFCFRKCSISMFHNGSISTITAEATSTTERKTVTMRDQEIIDSSEQHDRAIQRLERNRPSI